MVETVPNDDLWRSAVCLNRAAAQVDPHAARLPPLLFLTDPQRTAEPWRIAERLPPGSAVIHRGFGRPGAGDEARRLRQATLTRGVLLLIAHDADLAETVGADGMHLPEREVHRAPDLRAAQPRWLLTGAVHPPLGAPLPSGLDAVLVSPVFGVGGASTPRPPLGVEGLAAAIRDLGLPAYALGGVDAATATALLGTGACGIAAVQAVVRQFGA